jgi:hydrogenase maturation factor
VLVHVGFALSVIDEEEAQRTYAMLVVVRTVIGGSRVLERPYGELLPRIC